jgi:hypothetical protein
METITFTPVFTFKSSITTKTIATQTSEEEMFQPMMKVPTFLEEEMVPSLLEVYENDPAIFMDMLLGRKKNYLLFDVSSSLDENYSKALDMISFIVSRHPKCLSEREAYLILLRTSNPEQSQVLPREILDTLERMLTNPRYKYEIQTLRNGVYLKSLAKSMSSIFKF